MKKTKENYKSIKDQCFDFIIDDSNDIIIGISENFSIKIFNKFARKKFALSQQKVLNKNFFEVFLSKGVRAPITLDYFDNLIPKTIKMDALEWEIIPIASNVEKQNFALLIAKAEENGKKHNIAKNLDQIVNVTPGSLYWKDVKGKYLGCNMFMVKTSGLNLIDDIVGKTDFDLWPDNAEKIHKNDQYVMRSGKTVFLEEKVKIPNGNIMYFTGVKMPLKDEDGKVIGVIGNSLDITKLKETEIELKAAKKIAETSNKAKSEFIRNMEHDIRTPISGMWGITNILAKQETNPEKNEFLLDIENCAKELLEYCDSILDFSRIEHGTTPVVEKSFKVKDLIDSVIKLESIAAKLKKLNFSIACGEKTPKVLMGDPYRVKRILLNLVSNSIKFTQEGHVKLLVDIENANYQNRNCVIKFTVEDTGVGIPEDKKNIIYERFTRGTLSNKGIYKGQGLGLRIVKQFVTELDGDIHLTSEINKGTIFTVLLPFRLPLTNNIIDDN